MSTSLLTQSRRTRVIRGLLIGKHFTLQLGILSESQLDIRDGQLCRALPSAVSSVRKLPRTALHIRPRLRPPLPQSPSRPTHSLSPAQNHEPPRLKRPHG
jgi:hypothetical protein